MTNTINDSQILHRRLKTVKENGHSGSESSLKVTDSQYSNEERRVVNEQAAKASKGKEDAI